MNLSASAASRWPSALLLFLAAFALWLLNHPYVGLWHDSRIYGLLAAEWLAPQNYARELFFEFGSQGDLTLFTPLYAPLVEQFGLDRAGRLVVVAGGAAWIAAIQWLATKLIGRGWALRFVVLCAAILSLSYSPNGSVFLLTEAFPTARSIAVPLGVAAIAALAAGRHMTAWCLAVGSLLMHPLVGVWPLALCVLSSVRVGWAIVMCALPVAATILLGLFDLDMAGVRLIQEPWLTYVIEHSPDVMFASGGSTRSGAYLLTISALLAGCLLGNPSCRRLYGLMAALSAAALAMAGLTAYVWPVEFIVQGQPWRVFWLATVIGGIGAVDTVARLLARFVVPPIMRWSAFVAGLGLVAVSAWIDADVGAGRLMNPWWGNDSLAEGLLAGGLWQSAVLLASVPVVMGSLLAAASRWRVVFAASISVIAAGLIWVIAHWDRRVEIVRNEERCWLDDRCTLHPFRGIITAGDVVHWSGRDLAVWFHLRTAAYAGVNQSTGSVFSERKSVEAARRKALQSGDTADEPKRACSDPIVDWVVVGSTLADLEPAARDGGWHLYRCAAIRAGLGAVSPPR